MSARLTGPRSQHARGRDVLERQTATSRDLLRTDQALQRGHGGVHDVDRVVRAERLGQHVVDARALEHGAHRPTGDDAGTRAGRLEQHDPGGRLALNRVRDRLLDARHLEEVLLGLLDTLGDRGRHLLGLAVADAHGALTVADDDECGEAEPASTLDDLGHPVDAHEPLDVRTLLRGRGAAPPTVAAVAAVAALAPAGSVSALRSGHASSPSSAIAQRLAASRCQRLRDSWWSSELQPRFAGRVGERRHPAGVCVATAVEDDMGTTGVPGRLGQLLAELLGPRGLVAVGQLVRGRRQQRHALTVVDQLREQVPRGPGDDQTWTLRRAGDLLAQPEVPPRPRDPASGRYAVRAAGLLDDARRSHHLPVFPALRRTTSPWYRTPLPLYGSGRRSRRMFAATSPTFCLSMPSTENRVGFSTRDVIPSGADTRTGCEKPRANSSSLPLACTR